MSTIPTKQIYGDVSVGRNATTGGQVEVRGSVTVGHNLRVDGWLDARNIKEPCKGLFTTVDRLEEAYPDPRDGWYALVGYGLPADIYVAEDGAWGPTGERGGAISLAINTLEDQIDRLITEDARESSERRAADDELDRRLSDVETDLAEEQSLRLQTFTALNSDLMNERTVRAEADNAIEASLAELREEVDDDIKPDVDELKAIVPTLASKSELDERISSIDHPVEVRDIENADMVIANESGRPIVTFVDGHIRTDNFDSSAIHEYEPEIEVRDASADLVIADENGRAILTVDDGHVITGRFDSSTLSSGSGSTGSRTIRILSIGNSYSNDALGYVPFMARNIEPSLTVDVGIMYQGSCTLQTHWGNASSNARAYTLYRSDGSRPWTTQYNVSILTALQSQQWDIVLLQQQSSASRDYTTYQPYLENLVKYIYANAGCCPRIGWLMTPAYPANYTGLGVDTTDVMYNKIASAVKSVMASTAVSFVLPCGTAIQNARTDSTLVGLGQFGGLTYEGVHLQDGLPCQIEAYVILQSLYNMLGMPTSIFGDSTRVTSAWTAGKSIPEMHGTPVGSTDDNCYKAQKCAILAINNPFVISQI